MKRTVLVIFMLSVAIKGFCGNSIVSAKPERIAKYDITQENTVVLHTNFADEIIIDQQNVKALSKKQIHHVELVYTQFKSTPTFNQQSLNSHRISQLKKVLPQINSDNPTWSLIEQTGAKTADDAKTYFHGFVIHYSDKMDYEGLKTFFKEKEKTFATEKFDNKKGAEMKYESGTKVMIAPNSVTYSDGTPVVGEYTLKYREFRNAADIAFSGIPMTYNGPNGSYNFSSVGMYELRATQGDKELKLNKPATIDFNCTEQKEGVSFYKMDDETGEWKELHEVKFEGENEEAVPQIAMPANNVAAGWEEAEDLEFFAGWGRNMQFQSIEENNQTMKVTMNKPAWKSYEKLMEKQDTLFEDMKITQIENKHKILIDKDHHDEFIDIISWNGKPQVANNGWNMGDLNGKPIPNDKRATLLASGADAGHTYPSMVRGLNSSNFGVYNCDQIYRIGKAVTMAPTYIDKATGKEINAKHVACVIDLKYNGSFSFQPNYITCNKEGKNAILLFTKDKKVFVLMPEEFNELDKDEKRVTMKMKDVTAQVKTPGDLKKLLNII